MSATHKVWILKGTKAVAESAEHAIEFPGGSVSVCRTSDGEYWAHIAVNPHPPIEDADGFHHATAKVVDRRAGGSMEPSRPAQPGSVLIFREDDSPDKEVMTYRGEVVCMRKAACPDAELAGRLGRRNTKPATAGSGQKRAVVSEQQ